MDSTKFRSNPSPSSGDFLEDLGQELHLNDSDQSLLDLFASASQKNDVIYDENCLFYFTAGHILLERLEEFGMENNSRLCSISVQLLQHILGFLNFALQLFPLGKSFIRPWYKLASNFASSRVKLDPSPLAHLRDVFLKAFFLHFDLLGWPNPLCPSPLAHLRDVLPSLPSPLAHLRDVLFAF